MFENYLDEIFGEESKVDKERWIELVSTKLQWILKPETMRSYIYCDVLNNPDADKRSSDECPINVSNLKWKGPSMFVN